MATAVNLRKSFKLASSFNDLKHICGYRTNCVLGSNGIIGCCPIGELCSGPAGNPTTISNVPPPTLPVPLPTPTTDPLPPIQTTINRELVYIAWVSQYADIS